MTNRNNKSFTVPCAGTTARVQPRNLLRTCKEVDCQSLRNKKVCREGKSLAQQQYHIGTAAKAPAGSSWPRWRWPFYGHDGRGRCQVRGVGVVGGAASFWIVAATLLFMGVLLCSYLHRLAIGAFSSRFTMAYLDFVIVAPSFQKEKAAHVIA